MLEKKEHIYENAVLVGLITKDQDEEKLTEYMDELEFLAYTAGATVKKRFTQKLAQPDSRTFVGKGKAEEIKLFLEENEIGTVIFDDELSPSQLKNLERELEVKILDRTNLILDIFAQRAQNVYDGVLTGDEILRKCIVEHAYSSFVWAKLFKTGLVQKAYGKIPFTYCTMAEDMLLYFFIALYADKYLGIPDTVYKYRINTGLTSRRRITDLAGLQKVCSASSVFTIIFSYLDEHPAIGSEIREAVRDLGRAYYADNLKQLEVCVVPSLQEEARAMLEEWRGIYNL